MLRVMIADDNQDFCNMLRNYLALEEDMEVVAILADGSEVLPKVKEYKPDILLMDIVMPSMDGLEVLEHIRKLGEDRPRVIIVSAFGQDQLVTQAQQMGVDYYLMKPFSLSTLVRRIRQISAINSSYRFHEERRRQKLYDLIVHYLAKLGVPPHFKGYRYLIDAISLVAQDSGWLNGITTRLYPRIAQKYGTRAIQVERAIRHAIEITWEKGNLAELHRFFSYGIDAEKGKPTNSSFIAKMADIIKLETRHF